MQASLTLTQMGPPTDVALLREIGLPIYPRASSGQSRIDSEMWPLPKRKM
jgi:hypothetical protein